VKLPKEEVDAVGDLRYAWRALRKRSLDAAAELGRLQVPRGLHDDCAGTKSLLC
jgi:hypothetical protein